MAVTLSAAALVAIGALLALLIVALGIVGVGLVVRRHEQREDAAAAGRHREITDELAAMKRLTIRAITGREELERRVDEHEKRIRALEGSAEQGG